MIKTLVILAVSALLTAGTFSVAQPKPQAAELHVPIIIDAA